MHAVCKQVIKLVGIKSQDFKVDSQERERDGETELMMA